MTEKQVHLQDVIDERRWLSARFGYFTECALATVEHLEGLKRTSQRELLRHAEIANGMVAVCKALDDVTSVISTNTPRLSAILKRTEK